MLTQLTGWKHYSTQKTASTVPKWFCVYFNLTQITPPNLPIQSQTLPIRFSIPSQTALYDVDIVLA